MLPCGAGCCLWTRGFSGRRARPWGRAAPWAARPRAVRAATFDRRFGSLSNQAPPHRWGLVLTCGLVRRLEALLRLSTTNFAHNSSMTHSNIEFTSLELQRFYALLNLHPIELHATFEEGQAPPPTRTAARSPAFRSLRCPPRRWRWGVALHERVVGVSEPHVVQFPPFGDGEITV